MAFSAAASAGLVGDPCHIMPASVVECWWRPFRTVDRATVLHVNLTPHTAREAEAWAWLDEEEQARWQRYQHDGSRRRFALCRAALRAVLCRQLDCRNEQLAFGASDHGKPYAVVQGVAAPVSFNVSHSGAHGLIAVAAAGRLGVDVEERRAPRDLDGLISSVLRPDEQAELALASGCRKLHLFFNFWTIKEALIKALGLGLSLDMSQFEIPSAMRHGETMIIFQFPQMPTVRWRLEDLGNEHFAAAIAHELAPDSN